MDIPYIKFQLFGGAIEAEGPSSWEDVSKLIIVPDNQEVFNDRVDGTSSILEILERVDVSDDSAIEYFFNDLASHHDAVHSDLHKIIFSRSLNSSEVPFINPIWKKYILKGEQMVLRDNRPDYNRELVRLVMALIRYEEASSDILFTVNIPKETRSNEEFDSLLAKIETTVMKLMSSFKIIDMGLFG